MHCFSKTGLTTKIRQELLQCLAQVKISYPNTGFTCLLKMDDPEIIVTEHKTVPRMDELQSLVNSLLATASNFSDSIVKKEATVVHIKGSSRMFSLFDVGLGFVLAFYTSFDPVLLQSFDITEPDVAISGIIREIARILKKIK
ncbi:MAG: hypothetical protein EZS28_034849 [Streblomastix strix]|uniref:Roadblock/LAMTOR2 domain-containing protein n=1 Tax=Streblomastix strix TaxID=222440 RepID=A0A5J4UHG9_9EUKA|nr:MAG: hypothetical protein EZS28_034849 [Streblomastix strix]